MEINIIIFSEPYFKLIQGTFILCFVKHIKLYIESKFNIQQLLEYSHLNFTTKIVPIVSLK